MIRKALSITLIVVAVIALATIRHPGISQQVRASPPDGPAGSAPPSTSPTATVARTPHRRPEAGEVREMTIKELGNFEYDDTAGGTIPPDAMRLSGTKVRLRGFMMPLEQTEKIKRFALVPSLFGCCFGQSPSVQHFNMVDCPAGKAVSYFPDDVFVEGTLTVKETREEKYVVSLFNVTCSGVKPAGQ
jgi:hypothetical protein